MMQPRLPPVFVKRETPSPTAKFQAPWVRYPAGVAALKRMSALIARPDEGRPQNLAIIGGSNFGKSHLLDHFADCYPDVREEIPVRIQVVHAEVPADADGRMILRELHRNLGAQYRARDSYDELLYSLCMKMKGCSVAMVILDELHNGMTGRRDRTLNFMKSIRDLSNRIRRPVVGAGDERVRELLRYDPQLAERFSVMALPEWSDEAMVRKLLATFEECYPMPGPSALSSEPVIKDIRPYLGHRLGAIAEITREAFHIARSKGDLRVTASHFQAAYIARHGGLPH